MLPDYTFFIQLAIYWFLLATLFFTFFKPLLTIIQERKRRTVGELSDAEARIREFDDLYQQYSDKMNRAKAAFFDDKMKRIRAAESSAEQIRAEGRRKVEGELAKTQESFKSEAEKIKAEMLKHLDTLKSSIVERVVNG